MSPEELQEVMEKLNPDEFANIVAQLSGVPAESSQEPAVDSVAIKMQLISFVKDLIQQNMALEWEINKRKPMPLTVDDVITNATQLYNFVTSKDEI